MSHTLIVARPGDGKTYTAKALARAAFLRGETVIVFTTPFHTNEWTDISGVTVTSDEMLLELIAALITSPSEHANVTLIVDDIEKTVSGTAQQALERIVRLGRGVRTVITTSHIELVPAGIISITDVSELRIVNGKRVRIVDEHAA